MTHVCPIRDIECGRRADRWCEGCPLRQKSVAPARTAQVLRFRGVTHRDIDPAQVLDGARNLPCVVVLGYDKDGAEYFASSVADGADVLWLLERLKAQLLAADTP
jgi:hypothetical protein